MILVGFAKNTGKRLVFGTAKQLLYSIGVAERGGMWAEDEALSDWYSAWTHGSKPTPLLEKRVDVVQCEYYCDNVTIWDVFHEMSLRHPGWVYGARPYGTKFRYTMFFGVPSQRYWAKPASNNFIHRMTRLRKYAGVQVTEESYKLLYGSDSLDSLKRDIENKVVTIAKQRNYGHMGEQEELLYPDAPEMEMSFGEAIASNYVHKDSYNEHLRLEMTNRVLEEYLLGLQNRFLPFRRYHYITSDADIVHNGIVSSNRGVVNAVSVLLQYSRL